jgi:probable phosphoglycerate mutase
MYKEASSLMLPPHPFYIMRHGETEANLAEIMAGQVNSPLTAKGWQQADVARTVVESLAVKPTLIVHSHLDRAKNTAITVNKNLGIPMIEDKDISEIFVGDWEGTSYDFSLVPYLQGIDPPNGEAHKDFRSRVAGCVRRYCEKHEAPILFVCHGGVMRALASLYKINSHRFQNCHLHEFEPYKASTTTLPWRVWQHDILENGVIKRNPSELFHDPVEDDLLIKASGSQKKHPSPAA